MLALMGGVGFAGAPAALGHGAAEHSDLSIAQTKAIETEELGAEHAAEHAREARALRDLQHRFEAMSPAEQRAAWQRSQREAKQLQKRTAGDPVKVGAWRPQADPIPNYAIHSAMLPTGKVLFFGYPTGKRPNEGRATLWDPRLGTGPAAYAEVPPPYVDPDGAGPQPAGPAPIYCSAQSFLPDGRLLVSGGNMAWPSDEDGFTGYTGLDTVFTFDPWTESWQYEGRMSEGRWYPSQVLLGDGRTLIAGGYTANAPGDVQAQTVDVFDPDGTAPTAPVQMPSAARTLGLYPHLFAMPSGEVLLAGPRNEDSALLGGLGRGQTPAWKQLPGSAYYRVGGNSVLLPGDEKGDYRVTQIGGYGQVPSSDGFGPATSSTETIDLRDRKPRWKPGPSLNDERSYQNTVLLPDGSMVAVGGGTGYSTADGNYTTAENGSRRRVELYDPARNRWRRGPAQLEDRTYHSTALLLPDGRVWSAGDDFHGSDPLQTPSSTDTAEIYSPPYLFAGKRPRITGGPDAMGYRQVHELDVNDAKSVKKVVLVAPSAVTHGNDMGQRIIRLHKFAANPPHQMQITAPPSSKVAPPGYYMLFAISRNGVPSLARWVKLGV